MRQKSTYLNIAIVPTFVGRQCDKGIFSLIWIIVGFF